MEKERSIVESLERINETLKNIEQELGCISTHTFDMSTDILAIADSLEISDNANSPCINKVKKRK